MDIDNAFSFDGSLIALGGIGTGGVVTFDAITGLQEQSFPEEPSYVNADVAFSPDGTQLVTVAATGERTRPTIWNVATGASVRSLVGPADVAEQTVAWSPRGDLIVTGGIFSDTRVWDSSSGELVKSLETQVRDVAFSSDGSKLATAGTDVFVWEVSTWERSSAFSGYSGSIVAISFSPDGTQLLGGGNDNRPRLWDVATGTVLTALPAHEAPVSGVAFSPDGATLATVSVDGLLRLSPRDSPS